VLIPSAVAPARMKLCAVCNRVDGLLSFERLGRAAIQLQYSVTEMG